MPNPGPSTTITEHPIGGGGSPAYLGGSTQSAIGFFQDPYGGGAVTQRTGPIQAVIAVSQASGFLINYTSLSQGSPTLSAQNVSSTQITLSGAPQLSTADVVIANKQAFVSNFAVGQTVRVVSVSQQINTLVVALSALNTNVSGSGGTVTPNGETYVMSAFKGPLVNTVTLTPAVVAGNTVAEQTFTVAHQANYVMQNSILGHLHLPENKHIRNVREQGNTAAAGCPSAIAQKLEKLHKGDQLVYAVLGSGLAWGGGCAPAPGSAARRSARPAGGRGAGALSRSTGNP